MTDEVRELLAKQIPEPSLPVSLNPVVLFLEGLLEQIADLESRLEELEAE